MPEAGEVPIAELRSSVVTVEPGIAGAVAAEEKAISPLLAPIRTTAIEFARTHEAKPWLLESIHDERHLDGVVAAMRHVKGGQEYILQELQKTKPDLQWYRGGTLRKWSEEMPVGNHQYFTEEELDTYVIDGGKNGILGKPSTALGFPSYGTPSKSSFLYTLIRRLTYRATNSSN